MKADNNSKKIRFERKADIDRCPITVRQSPLSGTG